ncbi:MAG: hypothetical protein AB7I33_01380 [Gemmatimonadales bacterium]
MLFLALVAGGRQAGAQARALPFDRGWELKGPGIRVASYMGRQALQLRTGTALRPDVRLRDGTIDLQMAASGRRSFAFVHFRMQSSAEHEEIYFRPHKAELPDAVQYAPVWRGESYWQFFHGPGGTAAVELPRDTWVPVRIVLSGSRAAVFVGDTVTPDMIVPRLAREAAEGSLGLGAFLPQGFAGESEWPVSFADVVVRPGYVPFDLSGAPAATTAAPGTIMRWQLSRAFVTGDDPIAVLPDSIAAGPGWTRTEADPEGRVLVLRHRARPDPDRRSAVLGRVVLASPRDTQLPIQLAFSDEVTVFLNGRPLFYGDDRYRPDSPRQDGVVSFRQATVYLPLRAGRNELVLAVADEFGGWGFGARLAGDAGVTVMAEAPATAP